jgi:hypothetical protein
VSIDERRAKFRQDLMYQDAGKDKRRGRTHQKLHDIHTKVDNEKPKVSNEKAKVDNEKYRARRGTVSGPSGGGNQSRGRRDTLAPPESEAAFRPRSRSRSRTTRGSTDGSETSHAEFEYDSDSDEEQDIDEIW